MIALARQAVLVGLLCVALAASASAGIYFSEFGGAKQIWMTADSFTQKSTDGFTVDGAATNALPGGTYYFPGPTEAQDLMLQPTTYDAFSHPFESNDWWAQYEIPVSLLPGSWGSLEDTTWGFYVRTMTTLNGSADSNFLIVNGHPADLDMALPQGADWLYAATISGNPVAPSGSATSLDDRIQNGLAPQGHIGYDNWSWHSDSGTSDETLDRVVHKQFGIRDGKVTFRIYEREAFEANGRNNGMVWVLDPADTYKPGDADARLAGVPEPSSLVAICMGMPALLALMRRRRS